MTIITMSRQVGSAAEELIERICNEWGLRLFDKSLMLHIAEEMGISEQEIEDYSEDEYQPRIQQFFDELLRKRQATARGAIGEPETRTREQRARILDTEQALDLVRATILSAYEEGDILIVGRGGQVILADKPGVLHLRIVAPLETRIQWLQETQDMTESTARRFVAQRDQATEEFIQLFHNAAVDDPLLYDMMLNTGGLGVEKCFAVIKTAVGNGNA